MQTNLIAPLHSQLRLLRIQLDQQLPAAIWYPVMVSTSTWKHALVCLRQYQQQQFLVGTSEAVTSLTTTYLVAVVVDPEGGGNVMIGNGTLNEEFSVQHFVSCARTLKSIYQEVRY